MTTLINALKSEITRLARKELKADLLSLRKAATAQRSEIAALKREIKEVRAQIRTDQKVLKQVQPEQPAAADVPQGSLRFSAEGFAAQRARLGLTQVQMVQLVGVTCSPLAVPI